MADSVQSISFDTSVLLYIKEDEEAKFFARTTNFLSGRYFLKTQFHDKFVGHIHACRRGLTFWTYVSGIQGLGKTSSVLYYVLECRKNGDFGVHYFDLNKIEAKDEELETFSKFSEKFEDGHCVIVDHVTIYNSHYLDKIKKITRKKEINFILIETGFTASAHKIVEFGKGLQLNEDCFLKIWKGSLQLLGCHDSSLTDIGNEIYAVFSERFIVTPRLLHMVLDYVMKSSDLTVPEILRQYTLDRQNEISNFKGCQPGSNKEYEKFQLHTTILLQYVPDEGEYIFTEEEAKDVKLAVNIFEMKSCRVTKNDLEMNLEVLQREFNEGDFYIKVRHLTPFLANEWRKRLPFHLEEVLEEGASDEIFTIMFQNGGARKEFARLLIGTQQKVGLVILPDVKVSETIYQKSDTKQEVFQTDSLKLMVMPSQNFLIPNTSLDSYHKDLPENFRGHERNVALFGVYLKELVASLDKFVAYPQVQNFMGFDYFVYQQTETEEKKPPTKKAKSRENSVLYLIQVATGSSHVGETMGKALEVMKRIFSDVNVTLHVVVIIARGDDKPYNLNRCSFENLSVINLYTRNSDGIQNLLQRNELLYKFYSHLIENKLRLQPISQDS